MVHNVKHLAVRAVFLGLSLILTTFAATTTAAPAATSERYCSRPIKVALFEYGVLFRASNGDGIDSRLLAALETKTGCKFEPVVMPRKRIWLELEAGRLDMVTAGIPTPERNEFSHALPYFKGRNMLLMQADKSLQASSLGEFEASTLRLGVVRGFRHEPYFDSLISRMASQPRRLVEAADVQDLFRMLQRGVVDATIAEPIVFNEYLTPEQMRQLVIRDWAPADQAAVGALMLQRKSFTTAQAQAWDALVVRMIRDGSMAQIYRRFLSAADTKKALYTGPRMLD